MSKYNYTTSNTQVARIKITIKKALGFLGIFLVHVLGVQEQVRKRVGFTGGVHATDDADAARPNRLHRRDTPHHLKNKRINATIDRDKVASIIAQVLYFTFKQPGFGVCGSLVLLLLFAFLTLLLVGTLFSSLSLVF